MADSAALGYNQITDLSAARVPAFGMTGGVPPIRSVWALIQAEAQDVRWRDDGVAPTSTVGMYLAAGDSMFYDGPLTAIKFIQVNAGAKLNVSFYRPPSETV